MRFSRKQPCLYFPAPVFHFKSALTLFFILISQVCSLKSIPPSHRNPSESRTAFGGEGRSPRCLRADGAGGAPPATAGWQGNVSPGGEAQPRAPLHHLCCPAEGLGMEQSSSSQLGTTAESQSHLQLAKGTGKPVGASSLPRSSPLPPGPRGAELVSQHIVLCRARGFPAPPA